MFGERIPQEQYCVLHSASYQGDVNMLPTSDGNLDYLVKLVSAKFLHCNYYFPLCN